METATSTEQTAVESAVKVSVNAELQADIAEAVEIASGAMRHRTASNLKIAAVLVRSIAREVLNAAKSTEDIADFREQTVGLFSGPISKATGDALTSKKLSEYLRIHYMCEQLSIEAADVVGRVNWESLRTLARWSIHQPGETLFDLTKGEQEYLEAWKIKDGCEEKLNELVVSLADRPKDRAALIKAMDAHEGIATTTASDFEKITKFLGSVEKFMKSAGMSKAELAGWLLKAKILDALNGYMPNAMDVNTANAFARELIANKQDAACHAIIAALATHAKATSKPSTGPSVVLDALALSATRIVKAAG